ncbi:MAG: ABC transporter ATP-binding protein [Ruminococcaceae bacterium]|nr:ABC transporter ATP-binding protein [Oscillospiraceae bacterium]
MKRWMKYVKPYKWAFILGPLCMIVEVVGEVILPKLLQKIIDGKTGSDIAAGSSTAYIATMAGLMGATAILMLIGGVGGAYFGAKASVGFASDLRMDAYKKIQSFSFANIDKFRTGSLVTRLTNDITQLQTFVNMLLRMCLRSPGMIVGATIMAAITNPKLASVLFISIPLVLCIIFVVIRAGFPRFSKMQGRIDNLNTTVQESLTNVRVVKSFVREDTEKQKFYTANAELKTAGLSAFNVMILMHPLMMLILNGTIITVLWLGGNQVIGGDMSRGELSAFLTYINQILMSLMMITMLFVVSSRAMASAKRVAEVLDEEPDIKDGAGIEEDLTVKEGGIRFENVSFRYYKDSPDRVLENISLDIPAGATVGIIGSTGCGKTTLVSLIPRLYDVDEGAVYIDGVNVKDYGLVNLRDGIGMVLQKNVLFSGSVEDNLRWGDGEATDEELRAAASYAQADGFISEMEGGYKSDLVQGGLNVSGGQKQRLCIARALLKKPKILILDDSTSAVDTATEAKIRQAFKTDLSGSTKLIIAQRISSVMGADMIVVMNDGRITGVGTHEELLSSNEEYSEIYHSQTDGKGDK